MTTLAAGPSHTSIIPTLTVCLHSFVVSMSGPAFNSECVAKLFAALRTSNYRIRLNDFFESICAAVLVRESILLIWS
jgi:hypothetical protein